MKKRSAILYHFTGKADDILQNGFKGGDDGLVWFAEHPTHAIGEKERTYLLMAIFTVPVAGLSEYSYPVEEDGPEEFRGIMLYGIPVNVINGIIRKVIMVPQKQRKKMIV